MDSGNSGSMQSSSCGEDQIEEYDSRAAFIHNQQLPTLPTTTTITRMSHLINQPTQSSSLQLQHHQQMFDPLIANYYMDNSLHKSSSSPSSNQNSFINLDHMMWSKATTAAARSELQNNNDLSSLMLPSSSSSSSQQNQQAFLLSQMVGQTRENVGSVSTTHHSLQQLDHQNVSRGTSLTNDQQNIGNKNPKKRSRASRRAPTTVLTTDTTNFRAMVQEFTGIPAQPFSSPFPRTRLDLFGSSRSISSSSSSQMDPLQPPSYLLRPFAQKIQTPNHFSLISSSMVENFVASSNNSTNNSATINNYQQNLQHLQHPLMQQHNQILGFQSISQTPTTKYSVGTHQPSLEISPNVDSHVNTNNNNSSSNNNIGVLLHQNMVPTSSDRINNNMRNSSENQWGRRTSGSTNINGDGDGDNRGIVGSLSSIEERNCTSDFGVEKGQECVTTTRGEGTVESWINCSSSD